MNRTLPYILSAFAIAGVLVFFAVRMLQPYIKTADQVMALFVGVGCLAVLFGSVVVLVANERRCE